MDLDFFDFLLNNPFILLSTNFIIAESVNYNKKKKKDINTSQTCDQGWETLRIQTPYRDAQLPIALQ